MSTATSTVAAQRSRTHRIAVTAMLSAAATVLMFLEFPIPFLIPSFVELDFSDSVKEELRGMVGRVEELYILTKEAIVEKDARLLPRIDRVEDQVDGLRKRLIDSHIQRLNQGACKAESSGVFINLVSNLERMGDHLTYIAHTIG